MDPNHMAHSAFAPLSQRHFEDAFIHPTLLKPYPMQFQLLIAAALVLIHINSALAGMDVPLPQPLLKQGPCPSAYLQSGNYCTPTQSAHFAVAKNGPCPSGYTTSSNYCLALNGARYVIPKKGPCPSGWTQSANYCMRLSN